MPSSDVLIDAYGRIREAVHRATAGMSAEQLAFRVDSQANSIGWLVWHLTRVQDDHIADAAGLQQIWTAGGWVERFGLPFDASATGFGHSSAEVAEVRVASPDLLTGYHDAVHDQTVRYVQGLADPDLERVIDEAWDPPVTLGVRLVSVIGDGLAHAGQAAFVQGIVQRRDGES